MLFNCSEYLEESHKERNVYSKIFAGCIFNELICQNKEFKLAKRFFSQMEESYRKTCREFQLSPQKEVTNCLKDFQNDDNLRKLHVDFDHHLPKRCGGDRGEISDILIMGHNCLIGIEVKLNTKWKYEKDIICEQERIRQIKNENVGYFTRVHCILTKREKWEAVKKQVNRSSSNYENLKIYLQGKDKKWTEPLPFVRLFWEDLKNIIQEMNIEVVSAYLEKMLG